MRATRAKVRTLLVLVAVLVLSRGSETVAAETVQSAALSANAEVSQPKRGPVTNLPLPRFVSMKASEGNVRRGPSLTHRIDWVFTHRDMPLEIVAEYGHWRRVRDQEGAGGWMHYTLLSGVRTVIVQDDLTPLLAQPRDDASVNAHAEAGVVARLGKCGLDWCRISSGRAKGWVRKTQLWGVAKTELRD